MRTVSRAQDYAGVQFEKYPAMAGKPDFIIPSKRIAIFCDGDFWHGYNYLKKGKRLNRSYWQKKITGNIARDKQTTKRLKADGWKVLRFWEHQILKSRRACIVKLQKALDNS